MSFEIMDIFGAKIQIIKNLENVIIFGTKNKTNLDALLIFHIFEFWRKNVHNMRDLRNNFWDDWK